MLKPPKPIKRAKPRPESDAAREVLAAITPADVLAAQVLVSEIKERGSYTEDGKIKYIGGKAAREYWGKS